MNELNDMLNKRGMKQSPCNFEDHIHLDLRNNLRIIQDSRFSNNWDIYLFFIWYVFECSYHIYLLFCALLLFL